MAKKKLTAGQAALNRGFKKIALVYDPDFGDIHSKLLDIERAAEAIRRRLKALARERQAGRT